MADERMATPANRRVPSDAMLVASFVVLLFEDGFFFRFSS